MNGDLIISMIQGWDWFWYSLSSGLSLGIIILYIYPTHNHPYVATMAMWQETQDSLIAKQDWTYDWQLRELTDSQITRNQSTMTTYRIFAPFKIIQQKKRL